MESTQSSFLSKLPLVMATIGETKTLLSGKKLQLLEVKLSGKDAEELTNQLEIEWGFLESEIDLLEHTANVMRMDLMKRQSLVVKSPEEMMIVNQLKLGVCVGATEDVSVFNGKVYVPENLPEKVVKAIKAVEEACEIF